MKHQKQKNTKCVFMSVILYNQENLLTLNEKQTRPCNHIRFCVISYVGCHFMCNDSYLKSKSTVGRQNKKIMNAKEYIKQHIRNFDHSFIKLKSTQDKNIQKATKCAISRFKVKNLLRRYKINI